MKVGRLVAAAALALGLVTGVHAASKVGETAPHFAIRDLYDASRTVDSSRMLAGKTTLVSFFATWCRPCLEEIPRFREMADRYGPQGFQVVLISLDRIDAAEIRDFLKKAGISGLEILWDEDGDAAGEYGVFALPTNVVVAPSGAVAMIWQGYQPKKIAELEARLQKLAAGPAPR